MIGTDVHQFSIIIELLGSPPEDVIGTICSSNVSVCYFPLLDVSDLVLDLTICKGFTASGRDPFQREAIMQRSSWSVLALPELRMVY
jgi:hypothetical protein